MMGIKENFTQAVKELTGIGDKKSDRGSIQSEPPQQTDGAPSEMNAKGGKAVDELRKGLYSESDETRKITLDSNGSGFPKEVKKIGDDLSAIQNLQDAKADDDFAGLAQMDDFAGLDDLDNLSTATNVRPLAGSGSPKDAFDNAEASEAATTPVAEEFLSGGEPPVSLFGGQPAGAKVAPASPPPVQPMPEASPVAPPASAQTSLPPRQPEPSVQPSPAQTSAAFAGTGSTFSQPESRETGGNWNASSPRPMTPPPRPMSSVPLTVASSRGSSATASDDSELTIISRNTMIDGNIRSFADMSIDGDVKGAVETTKNIDLNGKIVGDISCNNAMMHTSQIQGNVRMKGNVSMKRDTLLIGDLMSTYAEVNGKIKGNLDVVGKADLRGDAVVFGDISASTITVEDGAIIQGYVSTTFLNKEESRNLFPDTIVIDESGVV